MPGSSRRRFFSTSALSNLEKPARARHQRQDRFTRPAVARCRTNISAAGVAPDKPLLLPRPGTLAQGVRARSAERLRKLAPVRRPPGSTHAALLRDRAWLQRFGIAGGAELLFPRVFYSEPRSAQEFVLPQTAQRFAPCAWRERA